MNPGENQTGPGYSLWQLVRYMTKLGTIGFGGPVALVGYMYRDLVESRKWISESDYKEGLALSQLRFMPKKGAELVLKTLESAVANAEHNHGADIDELKISAIQVDAAPLLKRFHARAKGRGNRIVKRTSHITVHVSDGRKE